MSDQAWIALAALCFGFVIALVGGVVWLVRLEGKTTANHVATLGQKERLDGHVTAQDRAREEIIRLQEQIKHLTDLIERWLQPPPRTRLPPSSDN